MSASMGARVTTWTRRLASVGVGCAGLTLGGVGLAAPGMQLVGAPELVGAHVISTERTEVKIGISPDGRIALFGTMGWEGGAGSWDIWMSHRDGDAWGAPVPVSFNSAAKDFDPAFSPDGKRVVFFSDREGGLGNEDIYVVDFDPATGRFGGARNLGGTVNSAGAEWGASFSPDGTRLLFCTDGRGGAGKHDLFVSEVDGQSFRSAWRLSGPINGASDEFDASFLPDGHTVVFARELNTDEVSLFVASVDANGSSAPVRLPRSINPINGWTFGSAISISEPGWLYFTAALPNLSVGHTDIYRVRYR